MPIYKENKVVKVSVQTPVGNILLVSNGRALIAAKYIFSANDLKEYGNILCITDEVLQQGKKELDEYFSGYRSSFSVALECDGTDFQKLVWDKLCSIAYGKVMTYKDIAVALNNPNASRAVGRACRTNKLAIFIPCHRVIGSGGNLTGYCGDKVGIKQQLLGLERGPCGNKL